MSDRPDRRATLLALVAAAWASATAAAPRARTMAFRDLERLDMPRGETTVSLSDRGRATLIECPPDGLSASGRGYWWTTSNSGRRVWRLSVQTIRPENVGVTAVRGDADVSAGLNAALEYSARFRVPFEAPAGAVYLCGAVNAKGFLNNAGTGVYSADYAVEIPDGAVARWNGAVLKAVRGQTATVLSNRSTGLTRGDAFTCENVVVDGDGVTPEGELVTFIGGRHCRISGLEVRNVRRAACGVYSMTDSDVGDLYVHDVVGQGFILGGNSDAYRLKTCRIGRGRGERIDSWEAFHQPGNPFLIGMQDSRIDSLTSRNCAGGIKYAPNCSNVHTVFAGFDGAPALGERDLGTQNSGIKIQGDSDAAACRNITFDTVRVGNGRGAGLYVRYATGLRIDVLITDGNGRSGLDSEIDAGVFDDLEIGIWSARNLRQGGLYVPAPRDGRPMRYRIGRVNLAGPIGSAANTTPVPIQLSGGQGQIDALVCQGRLRASECAHITRDAASKVTLRIGDQLLGR